MHSPQCTHDAGLGIPLHQIPTYVCAPSSPRPPPRQAQALLAALQEDAARHPTHLFTLPDGVLSVSALASSITDITLQIWGDRLFQPRSDVVRPPRSTASTNPCPSAPSEPHHTTRAPVRAVCSLLCGRHLGQRRGAHDGAYKNVTRTALGTRARSSPTAVKLVPAGDLAHLARPRTFRLRATRVSGARQPGNGPRLRPFATGASEHLRNERRGSAGSEQQSVSTWAGERLKQAQTVGRADGERS